MINEISFKFPSQFLITKITTSFDNNFYPLCINNSFEAEKFELDPTFENTINEIKDNNLKSIASDATDPSAKTYFEDNFDPLCINNSFESEKFEPEPTFENTINEIKDNNLKSIASDATNPSVIISFDDNFDPLCINNRFEEAKSEPEPTFEKTINETTANHLKNITSIDMNVSAITPNKPYFSSKHLKSDIMP